VADFKTSIFGVRFDAILHALQSLNWNYGRGDITHVDLGSPCQFNIGGVVHVKLGGGGVDDFRFQITPHRVDRDVPSVELRFRGRRRIVRSDSYAE